MKNPVAVITAKSSSSRLADKNMLPLGGQPLVIWSIQEALRQGLQTIVSTDIPWLFEKASSMGCLFVQQNPLLGHKKVIEEALKEKKLEDHPCILLQPTSPFRFGNIISKCWKKYKENNELNTILTSNSVHNAIISDKKLNNYNEHIDFWDGNIAIFPPNKICNYDSVVCVRNLPINSLQIDCEEDYVMACTSFEMLKPINYVLPSSMNIIISSIFDKYNFSKNITLVGRPEDGKNIPQDNPVFYINHCRGYDGQRCDGLFIIANENIKKCGINNELRECAKKAKIVIVRHNGQLDWLLQNLPEIFDKYYPIRDAIKSLDDHLTTGAIAANILFSLGFNINFIGMYKPGDITNTLDKFHFPAMSREIALLYIAGVFDNNYGVP